MEPIVIVHGGAGAHGDFNNDRNKTVMVKVKEAARIGYSIVYKGGSAIDAVEAAAIFLEDEPEFNAGRGSVLTNDGKVEMDALILKGENLEAGSVAGIKNVKNPISVARLVMEKTEHCMLAGSEATRFAENCGITLIPDEDLITDTTLELHRKRSELSKSASAGPCDTIGAVALDRNGHIAVATSTGGRKNQMTGRIGDSPIIGAGGYCDNKIGGVSTTGYGENIMKVCLAQRIIFLMETGMSAEKAMKTSLDYMQQRLSGYGGAICISNRGDFAHACSTLGMSWAAIKGPSLYYGIAQSDDNREDFSPIDISNINKNV